MTAHTTTAHDVSLRYREAQDIEEHAWWDIYQAAPRAYAQENGLQASRFPGGTCFAHRLLPSALFNRVLKFGVESSVTQKMFEQLHTWIDEHANPTYSFGVDPNSEPAQLEQWLHASGLRVTGGGIARFVHEGIALARSVESQLTVREVERDEQVLFGTLVRLAFGFPEGFETWFAQLVGRPGWRTYFACENTKPVGVGALYMKDGIAWLGVGATLEAYRMRGAQSALLNRRLRDAVKMGATGIHVETGHPAPGDLIGPSYRNILRAGFNLMFVRDQYMPAKR